MPIVEYQRFDVRCRIHEENFADEQAVVAPGMRGSHARRDPRQVLAAIVEQVPPPIGSGGAEASPEG